MRIKPSGIRILIRIIVLITGAPRLVAVNHRSSYTVHTDVTPEDRQVESGRWSVDNTAYRQDSRRNGLSFVGDESWSDYSLTL